MTLPDDRNVPAADSPELKNFLMRLYLENRGERQEGELCVLQSLQAEDEDQATRGMGQDTFQR